MAGEERATEVLVEHHLRDSTDIEGFSNLNRANEIPRDLASLVARLATTNSERVTTLEDRSM